MVEERPGSGTVEYDVILRNGTVIDGTGGPPRPADVGIRSGIIDAVEDLSAAIAGEVVDVPGSVVAPGFIDVHAHTDLANLLPDEHTDVKIAGLRQGVTTEVCGNCGFSPFPTPPQGMKNEADPYLGLMKGQASRYFSTFAEYRTEMDAVPLAANLAPLLGHNAVRASVMGYEDRAPTEDELTSMRRVVAQAMEEGAFGLSTGLFYPPGVYSQTEEIIDLAGIVSSHGRVYTTHMRDEADFLEVALSEALRIGREADIAVEISHHKAAGRRNWGKSQHTLAAIGDARASGLDVTIDVYPYTAGSTWLAALLPPWANEGGSDALRSRLADERARERMARDYAEGIPGWQNLVAMCGWDNVVVAGDDAYAGLSVKDIATETGRSDVQVVCDLLLEDIATVIVIHLMEQGEVESLGSQPFALVGSDGLPIPGKQHPRLAGTFARLLRRAADQGEPSLVDLVRRASALAADKFRIPDRGYVTKGKVADIVVFDPATIRDRSTYPDPWLRPDGVDHVLISGAFVIRNGEDVGVRAGSVLQPS